MNKIKKYICLFVSILFSVLSSSTFTFAEEKGTVDDPIITGSITDYVDPIENFNDLEECSKFIIKATVLPNSKNILLDDLWGYTKTKLKVNKVYQGDIQEGEIISLSEPYFLFTFTDGKVYQSFSDNYDKSEVGREYIFFLGKYDAEDLYVLMNGTLGRYPVLKETRGVEPDIDSLSNEDLDLGEYDTTTYREIYSEVLEKYN